MLLQQLDRLNQLNDSVSEINELKSQLLAELERLNSIESNTISEISDLQSEILSNTEILIPDVSKLADITFKSCKIEKFDNWDIFESQIKLYVSILRYNNQVYFVKQNKIVDANTLPGRSNTSLQKAVDAKFGYHKARYEAKITDWNPADEWNLPELEMDQFSSKREYWHANHIRKQIWYDCIENSNFWKSERLNWKRTDVSYWLEREDLVKLPNEVKQVMSTCPDRWNYGGFEHEIGQFVTDKIAYLKRLSEARQKYQLA